MAEEKKVIIDFVTRYQGIQEAAQAIQNTTNEVKKYAKEWDLSTSAVKSAMNSIEASQIAIKNQNNVIRVSDNLMKKSGLGVVELSRGLKNMGYVLDKTGNITTLFGKKVKMAEIDMKQLRKAAWRFNMNMLTLMFGLMAIQRIMTQFGRAAITTYQKANEDTEGLGKSTWYLQAAWEFFKYSLVDALTQSDLFKMFVEWLLKIVQWFNELDPGIKAFMAIGGAILFAVVSAGLLYAQLMPLFSYLATEVPIISTLLTGGLGGALLWVAAIVAAVVLLWITDFGNFRDFVKSTLGIIFSFFGFIFKKIWQIVKTVLDLVVAIFKGDFDRVYVLLKNFLMHYVELFIKMNMYLGAAILNIFKWLWNLIMDGWQFTLNAAIAAINGIIKIANKIPGVNIPLAAKVDLSSFKVAYTTMEDMNKAFDVIDKKMGFDKLNSDISVPTTAKEVKNEDNRTFNIDMDFNLPDVGANVDDLSSQIMDKITDELNRLTDSNNT